MTSWISILVGYYDQGKRVESILWRDFGKEAWPQEKSTILMAARAGKLFKAASASTTEQIF
jgi:hypothetical protein